MNNINSTTHSSRSYTETNYNGMVSALHSPFLSIRKICQMICQIVYYPIKLVAGLFEKTPSPSLTAPTPLPPTFLQQAEKQIKPYIREIACLTGLGVVGLVTYLYNKDSTVQLSNSSHFFKTSSGREIEGGTLVLATVVFSAFMMTSVYTITKCGKYVSSKCFTNPQIGNTQTGNTQTGNTQTGNTQTGNAQTGNAQTGNAQTGTTLSTAILFDSINSKLEKYIEKNQKKYDRNDFAPARWLKNKGKINSVDDYRKILTDLIESAEKNEFIQSIKKDLEQLKNRLSNEEFLADSVPYMDFIRALITINELPNQPETIVTNLTPSSPVYSLPSITNQVKSHIDTNYDKSAFITHCCNSITWLKDNSGVEYLKDYTFQNYQKSLTDLIENAGNNEFIKSIKGNLEAFSNNIISEDFEADRISYMELIKNLIAITTCPMTPPKDLKQLEEGGPNEETKVDRPSYTGFIKGLLPRKKFFITPPERAPAFTPVTPTPTLIPSSPSFSLGSITDRVDSHIKATNYNKESFRKVFCEAILWLNNGKVSPSFTDYQEKLTALIAEKNEFIKSIKEDLEGLRDSTSELAFEEDKSGYCALIKNLCAIADCPIEKST